MPIIRTGTRVVLILVALATLMPDRAASAQSMRRFEVGGQVSALRPQELGATHAGFGGRFSYELLDWLSVESEVNLFPRETFTVDAKPTFGLPYALVYRQRRSEALFGAKVGMRTERYGLFAKVRPGLARYSDQGAGCVGDGCAAVLFLARSSEDRTEFALDFGGVFEFYPSIRTVARIDVGDTVIRHRGQPAELSCSRCTSHNVASRVGIGLRF